MTKEPTIEQQLSNAKFALSKLEQLISSDSRKIKDDHKLVSRFKNYLDRIEEIRGIF